MGEIADDTINGACCELCGQYFQDEHGKLVKHGVPVVCRDCYYDLTDAERKMYTKAKYETL